MKYILIVNGYPRSGKDTFFKLLDSTSDLPLVTYSWVDKIKEIAKDMGWDGKKDLKGRKLLADLADANDDKCFEFIINKEKYASTLGWRYIFGICARRPKNIQELVEYYTKNCTDGYKISTICIRRDSIESLEQSNTADSEILDYNYDYYIDNSNESNNWLEEFRKNIEIFYEDLIKDTYAK